jgi:hypothetical protein
MINIKLDLNLIANIVDLASKDESGLIASLILLSRRKDKQNR